MSSGIFPIQQDPLVQRVAREQAQAEKRSQKACQACRIAKVRCVNVGLSPCVRCRAAAIACVFPPNRRGRIKGSRNRKTLQLLGEHSSNDQQRQPWSSMVDASSGSMGVMSVNAASSHEYPNAPPHPVATLNEFIPDRSEATTPLDPFDQSRTSPGPLQHLPSLNRRVLQHLEKSFPTDTGHGVDIEAGSPSDPNPRNLQHPLLFLAECARRGWDSDSRSLNIPTAIAALPPQDADRLRQWALQDVGRLVHDQKTFFYHGLHGSKRDVSATVALDAVQRGIIGEDLVEQLFGGYFQFCHPQWTMLDPTLHTPTFVRSRSAFLFTVILALGATAIATLPCATAVQRTRAIALFKHAEKLQLVICATAAKSVEIVQAELLYQMWALRTDRLVDDQRSARLGMTFRMAGQIGLQHSGRHSTSALTSDTLARNDLRLRLSLILIDSRWESIADRREVKAEEFDLSEAEAEQLALTGPGEPDAIIAADYALYRFEAESKKRIATIGCGSSSITSFDAERIWIMTYLDAWRDKWCAPQTDMLRRWYFVFASLRSRLVGLMRIAKARSQSEIWNERMRQDLLETGVSLLEEGLKDENGFHMLRPTSTFVFASTIILHLSEPQSSARDAILRVALRLAGRPEDGELMTYGRHNGYQLLNMLCLRKEAIGGAGIALLQPIDDASANRSAMSASADHTHGGGDLFAPTTHPGPTAGANGFDDFIDLNQILSQSGTIDFPYVPDQTMNNGSGTLNFSGSNNLWTDILASMPMSTEWGNAQAIPTPLTHTGENWMGSHSQRAGQVGQRATPDAGGLEYYMQLAATYGNGS